MTVSEAAVAESVTSMVAGWSAAAGPSLHDGGEGDRNTLVAPFWRRRDLLHQFPRPRGRCHDLLEVLLNQGAVGDVVDRHLGETDDRGEDVVEVVGDAPGQGADGLHLVGLAELFLEAVPLFHLFNEVPVCLFQFPGALPDAELEVVVDPAELLFGQVLTGNVDAQAGEGHYPALMDDR